jgi:hypothetical protein
MKIQKMNEIIPVIDIIHMENDNKLYFTEFKVTLHDNDFFIPVRSDGYINATILCKLGKKSFANYKKLKYTKELLNILSNDMNILISDLIIVKNDGNQKLRGTWIHGKLASNLSLWISTYIYVQMDKIFMYLFMLEKIYQLTNNLILAKKEAEEAHKKNIDLEEEIRQLEEELKE